MDYRQLKNDAYGIGQRRGMGNSGGKGGAYSQNFGGGGNYGSRGNPGGGGYGAYRNSSPDGGNFNRGGYNNNYSRSGDSGFNPKNQRFGGNSGDDFQGNFRGQSSNFDEPKIQASFDNGPSFGGNNGPAYGGNNGPSFGGNDGRSFAEKNPRNQGNFNNDNFPQGGSNFDDRRSGFNDSYGRGGNQSNFGQNSGNFDNNRDVGNFNNRGPGDQGFNQNSGGNYTNNNSGGGFSNNISRSFNESRNNSSWNNSASQSSSFQSSGYQSSGGGGGGGVGAGGGGWEASQRAFNSKRNQLQKMNLNNGGSVRKPGPQPSAKAVQNLRKNPRAAAAIVNAAGRNNVANTRNIQPNKPGNVRPEITGGVQKKLPIAAPNQYKVNNLAPKPKTAVVANKKPPVAGQVVRNGPPAVKTQGQRTGPQTITTGPQTGRPGQQPERSGQHDGKPAVVAQKPPIAPGLPPQVGQKLVAPAPQNKSNQPAIQAKKTTPGAQEPGQQINKVKSRAGRGKAKKANPNRQRVVSGQSFIIAGIRLPYINNHHRELPQPEEESFAVTFFKQRPIYNTNVYANNDGDVDEVEDEESDTESLDSNRSDVQSNKNSLGSKRKVRVQMRKEWVKIYKDNNYKDWHNWWRDYKWCGSEINKKLEKFGNRSLLHRFIPAYSKKASTEDVINQVFKHAHMGIEKNTFSHYRNMRSIFLLMNETFLENLSEEHIEQLQDMVLGIPNHLWLYKMRSMIYLWDRYHGTLKSPGPKNAHTVKQIQSIAREWKNPVFHWLAKQAFDELKAISEIDWPDHNKIYPGLKS